MPDNNDMKNLLKHNENEVQLLHCAFGLSDEEKAKIADDVESCLNTPRSHGAHVMIFDTKIQADYAKHVGQNFNPEITPKDDGRFILRFSLPMY